MDKKPLPVEWHGQQVRVGLSTVVPNGESDPHGTLDTVNESGLILLQQVKEGEQEGERPVFYPWGCIAWVHPKEEVKKKSMSFPRLTQNLQRTEAGWHDAP